MCTKQQLNTISNLIQGIYISVYGDKLKKIYLYGSYARGNNTEYSDIDYAAIVDDERPNVQSKLHQVWDAAADIGYDYDSIISPTAIPLSDFEMYKNALPYYRSIAMEGIDIG